MGQLEHSGTYVGEIVEAVVSTSKSGYPQLVARFAIEKGYIDDATRMEFFKLAEPGYVDWSSYSDEHLAYFILFNSATDFSEATKMFNYDDLVKTTGWDGADWDSLASSALGKKVLIRVQEETYNDKVSFKVKSIDLPDADPIRGLKAIDTKTLPKIKLAAAKKPAVAAKAPASKPPVASSPAAATPPATKPVPAASPSKGPPKKPIADAQQVTTSGLPAEVTQLEAWEYLEAHKGANALKDIEEAWISMSQEVGGTREEAALTGADWAKIRDLVIKDMAL